MNATDSLEVRIRMPLDRFHLDVAFTASRHVTGVFGVSGAGKTSLLESIAGLRRHARGRIRLEEAVWLDSDRRRFVPPQRRDIGYVPQEGLLFPHKDVRENLLSGGRRARRRRQPLEDIFHNVVDLLCLEPLLGRRVATLSGGERQRVALGRALCSGPRLLLLDEPLASLDMCLRRKVLPFLRSVRERFELPMFLISHDPVEVQALCDDLIVLQEGAIIARGEPRKVLTDPKVFPVAKGEGFENILPCTLLRTDPISTVVGLGTGRDTLELKTPKVEGRPGEAMLVSIGAREVIIAVAKPPGLSACNVFPAVVTQVSRLAYTGFIRVRLSATLPELVVEIAAHAGQELVLAPGQGVFLIIKTSACSVFASAHEPRAAACRPARAA